MEEYNLSKGLDFENLRLCIDNHTPEKLHIRKYHEIEQDRNHYFRGMEKVNENLNNKKFDFKKDDNGLHMLVNSEEIFHFPLKIRNTNFSLGYERIEQIEKGMWRKVILKTGIDPYDQRFPEPKSSFLRSVIYDHLMEIFFKGRINLKFHSLDKDNNKYRTINTKNTK